MENSCFPSPLIGPHGETQDIENVEEFTYLEAIFAQTT